MEMQQPAQGWRDRGLIATILVGPSFNGLSGFALDATIPAISHHFGGGSHGVLLAQLVLVAPGLFIIVGSPLAGALGRLLGLRLLMVAALAVYVIAGLFPMLQPGFAALIASRLLLGFASSMVSTNSVALAAGLPTKQRSKLIGLSTAVACVLTILGIVSAGWLTGELGWQASFIVYLWPLPLLPALFAMPTKVLGIVPVRSEDGWRPFINVAPIYLLALLWCAVMFSSSIAGPFILVARGLSDPATIGLIMGGTGLISAIMSAFYGSLSMRLRFDQQILLVFVLFFASATTIALAIGVPLTASGMMSNGLASGLVGPLVTALLIARLEPRHVATAFGLFTSMMFTSQLIDPFIFRAITVTDASPFRTWA